MTRAEIVAKVDNVLVEEFELEQELLEESATLIDDLGLDSLDAVDLIASLEGVFDTRVPEEDAKLVKTVGDVYSLIARSVAAPQG